MKLKIRIHLPFKVTVIINPFVWRFVIKSQVNPKVVARKEPVHIAPAEYKYRHTLEYRKTIRRFRTMFFCISVYHNRAVEVAEVCMVYPKNFHYKNVTQQEFERKLYELESTGYYA
jgi:hypothetical protein